MNEDARPLATSAPNRQATRSGSRPAKTPVVLLTGFLGAGKTTLINALLSDPDMSGTAVIVNEFGSVAVDNDLVHEGREGYVTTTTGCLCCTASSDVRASLFELYDARQKGLVPNFKRVIIETTGLADPAPIINSLIAGGAPALALRDHTVARAFQLMSVVTAFDVENGEANIGGHFECWKQLAFADHIVLTKTDLAPSANWIDDLRKLNPTAQFHDSRADSFDLNALFAGATYSASDRPEDVLGWLAMERLTSPEDHDHEHDINRHGADISAFPLVHDEPIERKDLDWFLDILTSQQHAGLLRFKGIFALTDDPTRPLVVHAVQHRLYPPVRLDYWPSEDVRSRAILIGEKLPIDPIRKLFASMHPKKSKKWFSKT